MHVILTHEQADFDSIGSLLGACLLYEHATAVLPRRMNRNVRAFLSLYGAELPFIDPRDLPNRPIEQITLVDTQSMVSLKGMTEQTRVEVIDHHPVREHLPETWSINTYETGATTTVFVESLLEHNGAISPIYSTLMLLGIYEDTGSLTYSRTTARDLRAAAALIDQGASLAIASDFLNHPLSLAQQVLYDRLRASAEEFHIHGYTIILTTGHAQEMEEELSSVAHKLRDLLDPDAIILLVTTKGGVQLIARSTTDNIDVSSIASVFGGGGHERAAAGLIRGQDLLQVKEELVRILPNHVRPAITVSQIMSIGPQVLSPETTAQEAARSMSRYGYEGYPVVKDGKVIGLLNRREVDRAIAHGLNFSAERLMIRGNYTVSPEDSIEALQRLVTETGWGQIPVADPVTGNVIGIVTRTDLLKTLTSSAGPAEKMNLISKLESALPHDRLSLLSTIAEVAYDQRSALYVVGGFVRDLLLEQPSLDFDLVVEGDAISLARALSRRFGGRVTGHARFGTAKWHLTEPGDDGQKSSIDVKDLETLDLISARTEFYTHPTALPIVERGSIKLDLHRRDFTINTLALRLDGRHYGELYDYWGGLNDLRAGLVRVLHSLSFVDDPTRILRAVRFEQRFAFRIEERTMELLDEARSLIDRLSGDRIRHELNHILESEFTAQILNRLAVLDLIQAIHPELIWDDWHYSRIDALKEVNPLPVWCIHETGLKLKRDLGFVIWMIQIDPAHVDGVIKRLKLSTQLGEAIRAASKLWQERNQIIDWPPSQATRYLNEIHPLARYAVYHSTTNPILRSILQEFVTNWRFVQPKIDGHFLKMKGVEPGPVYRIILDNLKNAWLDGLISSQEEETALFQKLLETTET